MKHSLANNWMLLGFKNNTLGTEECLPGYIGEITLGFDCNNRMKGLSSCNSFEGDYSVFDANSLLIQNFATTLNHCGSDTIMKWEDDYYRYLAQANSFNINADILIIKTSINNDLIYRYMENTVSIDSSCFDFETIEGNKQLIGTWYFKGYIDCKKHCKPDNINEMTLVFSDTNRLGGESSCNLFEADYYIFNNDSIQITNLITTELNCDFDFREEWEKLYYNALEDAKRFFIVDNKLTIETSNNTKLIFSAE